MTENARVNKGSSLSGKMFLYDKPELLNAEADLAWMP